MKDWIANKRSTFATLGASSHSKGDREEHDYYATDPIAVQRFMEEVKWSTEEEIWEPACGEGHIAKTLEDLNYIVHSTDLIDRGYGKSEIDFLQTTYRDVGINIITNPPYRYALEFVEKSLDTILPGYKVAMLLRIQFLEGVKRGKFFKTNPPKIVYVFSRRVACAINGKFEDVKGSATAFCWFVWEKGYTGETIVKWL